MSKPESGLDEVKRSRDYYRKEIEGKEREIVALKKQIDTIREKLPAKQKILDELNAIIEREEGK